MKIQLINPSWALDHSKVYTKIKPSVPPLGTAYVAAVLDKDGFEVRIDDQSNSNISNSVLIDRIKEYEPDIIGISCVTVAMKNIGYLIDRILKLPDRPKIILGNIHATALPGKTLTETSADIVIRGEGEYSMLETARAIKGGKSLDLISGISYREGPNVFHNPDRPLITDLDTLPYPAWHLFDLSLYRDCFSFGSYRENMLSVLSSRGCVNKCSFCAQDRIYPGIRFRKMEKVVEEIQYFYNKYGIYNFGFSDSCFPFSINTGMEFCTRLINRGLNRKIQWHSATRVDRLNPELVEKMKKAGSKAIFFGFESGNQKVLDKSGKHTTVEQAHRTVSWVKKANIRTSGFFMLGLPGDTVASCRDTINFAKEIDPDVAVFNITFPYPGSKLYEQSLDNHANYESYSRWNSFIAVKKELAYRPEKMTSRQVRNAQHRAILEFYLRPTKIWRCLVSGTLPLNYMVYGAFVALLILGGATCRFLKHPAGEGK